jgi:hypothetical protein
MKNFKPPQILVDVYRDLRDRRLLLPALVLLVAIVAVPLALSSSSTEPAAPPAPAAAAGSDKATAAEAAVLTRQLGVSDYRKRLEQFKSKNPFRQHFALPNITSKVQGSSVTVPTSGATSGITGASDGSTSTTSTSTTTTSSTSSSSPTSSTSAPTTSEPSQDQTPKPTTELVQRRVDVKVGKEGSPLEERDGVKQLTMLPDGTTPVVAFLGTSENGKHAYFVVSTDVSNVSGDGNCLTTTPTCQFLSLQEGEAESFDYTPDLSTYNLRLLNIKDVVVKKTRG